MGKERNKTWRTSLVSFAGGGCGLFFFFLSDSKKKRGGPARFAAGKTHFFCFPKESRSPSNPPVLVSRFPPFSGGVGARASSIPVGVARVEKRVKIEGKKIVCFF